MLSLVLTADQTPNGTIVRKVQGSQLYRIEDKIEIHCIGDKKVFVENGCKYLIRDRNISVIPADMKITVDFMSAQELIEFCEERLISHQ